MNLRIRTRSWMITTCMLGIAGAYMFSKEAGLWVRDEPPYNMAKTETRVRLAYYTLYLDDMAQSNGARDAYECRGARIAEHPLGKQMDPNTAYDTWGSSLMVTYCHSNLPVIRVWSVGPNKVDEGGGGDDINSWEPFNKQLRRYRRVCKMREEDTQRE